MEEKEPTVAKKNFYSTEWRRLMEVVKYNFAEDEVLLQDFDLDSAIAFVSARLIDKGLDPHEIFKAVGVEK
ncbi:MAG: hypothetical protein JWO99_154 [Candidatus Saccharibacteria bacterium]|nr:hypothetical protein [Candidatus Saccharibacteria bacterium]